MSDCKWYAFSPQANDTEVELSIYDEIGFFGVTAKEFAAELKEHAGKHVHLRINSVGGSVYDGNAIFNSLRRHKGGLTVHIDGLAASMASLIAMAGQKVFIADNAMMMIHNPWTISMGDADSLRKEAETLDKIKAAMVTAYRRRTGKDADEIADMMSEERWLDAQEAKEMGFADEIEDGIEAAASITPEVARARFDKLALRMANKSTPAKVDTAEEAMNAELQAKVDDLQAKVAAHEAEKAELAAASAQTSEAIQAEVESLKGEIERLTNEVATRDAEISRLAAEQKTAGEQAAAIVAGLGVDPAAQALDAPTETPAQIFAKLEGAKAVEFWRANKREIIATMTLS